MHCVADSCMHVLVAHEREESQACVMTGQADIPHDIPYEETCCHHADLPRRDALVGGFIGRLRPPVMLPADVEHRLEAVECIGCLFIHRVVQQWRTCDSIEYIYICMHYTDQSTITVLICSTMQISGDATCMGDLDLKVLSRLEEVDQPRRRIVDVQVGRCLQPPAWSIHT